MDIERFIKVYTFLPLEEWKLTVVMIDSEPISWLRAYKEITGKAPLGDRIFKKLAENDLI